MIYSAKERLHRRIINITQYVLSIITGVGLLLAAWFKFIDLCSGGSCEKWSYDLTLFLVYLGGGLLLLAPYYLYKGREHLNFISGS